MLYAVHNLVVNISSDEGDLVFEVLHGNYKDLVDLILVLLYEGRHACGRVKLFGTDDLDVVDILRAVAEGNLGIVHFKN